MRMADLTDERLLVYYKEAERLLMESMMYDDDGGVYAWGMACDAFRKEMDKRGLSVPVC